MGNGSGREGLRTPTIDGAGLIGAPTFDDRVPNKECLIDASVGTIVNTIDLDSPAFSQAVFAEKYVFAATSSGDLASYTPA